VASAAQSAIPGRGMARRGGGPGMSALLIDAPSVSLQRQLQCVRREIKIRRQVYLGRVATRRMSAKKAAEEIVAMQAIEETLVALIERRSS
jgi:hypothetical protein